MKFKSIRLGKLARVPIYMDYSWFIIFILLTWTLASDYFPSEFKGWPVMEYWGVGAITTILLFVSVLLHELGHSVVAMRYKIPVCKITLFIFGGIAQIGLEPPNALAELWIAIAGPIVSFALAGLFSLLTPILSTISPLFALVKYLAYINGTLCLFNLIPGFPLDGGRVFRALVWGISNSYRRATLIAANLGRLIGFLFILFGVWQMIRGSLGDGLWIVFIGWFLESAANAQVQQQMVQDMLAGHTVAQAMSRNFSVLNPDTTLQQLMDLHILGEGRRYFIVKDGDEIKGLLSLYQIKQIPREEWSFTTVSQKMFPLDKTQSTYPDELLVDAIKIMDNNSLNQIPVVEENKLLGILSRENLLNFLRTIHDADYPHKPRTHLTSGT